MTDHVRNAASTVPRRLAGREQAERFNRLPEPVKAYFSVLYRLQDPRLNAAQQYVLKRAQCTLLAGITRDATQQQALARFTEYLYEERTKQAGQREQL